MPHINPNSYNISALSRRHVPQKGATTDRSSSSIFNRYLPAFRPTVSDFNGNLTCYNPDGSVKYSRTYEYGADGKATRAVTYDSDGNVKFINKYEYDADGKTTRAVTYDSDGNVKFINKYEYDENGEIVKSKDTFYDDDGNVKFESEH